MDTFGAIDIRFIPVCTGNIKMTVPDEDEDSVYPCVYREHLLRNTNKTLNLGLSLCVQGTLDGNGG